MCAPNERGEQRTTSAQDLNNHFEITSVAEHHLRHRLGRDVVGDTFPRESDLATFHVPIALF